MTPPVGYNLIWNDEFDGTSLNSSKWKQDFGSNNNVKIADSKVTLWANPVGDFNGSAFISTLASFKYGYFECSAQISTVQGVAFAFWLLNPEGANPEIDIVERIGNAPDYQDICVFSAKGTDGLWASGGVHQSFPATAAGFHTYGLLWTQTQLTFYVDDAVGWNAPSSVISKCTTPLNVELDICAGGCSFQGIIVDPVPGTPPTNAQVEYVRVYQQDTLCSIKVTCPSTGLIYRTRDPKVIKWTSAGDVGNKLKIELLRSGSVVKTISTGTTNDGSFSWIIPFVSYSKEYQIKITSVTNSSCSGISGKFVIR